MKRIIGLEFLKNYGDWRYQQFEGKGQGIILLNYTPTQVWKKRKSSLSALHLPPQL
jgi:hypothetical protein